MKLGTYILALALCSVLRAGAQTNDARLTPTERATRNQLNQRAANTVAAAKAGGVVGALLIGAIEAGKHIFGK